MQENKIDYKYYINVAKIMKLNAPCCRLPRPKHKIPSIYNDGEFLPIISVECEN